MKARLKVISDEHGYRHWRLGDGTYDTYVEGRLRTKCEWTEDECAADGLRFADEHNIEIVNRKEFEG